MAVIHHADFEPPAAARDNTPGPDVDITAAAVDVRIVARTGSARRTRGALLEAVTVDGRK